MAQRKYSKTIKTWRTLPKPKRKSLWELWRDMVNYAADNEARDRDPTPPEDDPSNRSGGSGQAR